MARALGELLLPLSRGHKEGDRALGSAGASISFFLAYYLPQPVECREEIVKDILELIREFLQIQEYDSFPAYGSIFDC